MTKNNQRKVGKKVGQTGWLVGLIIALSASYVSFEYASTQVKWIKLADAEGIVLSETEITDVSIATTPPPPAPRPPVAPIDPVPDPQPIPQPVDPVVDPSDPNIVEGPVKYTGPKRPTTFLAPMAPLDQSELSKQAQFPGGLKAFYEYLGNNLKYPELAKEMRIQGKVFVEFVVDKKGKIKDVKILRGLDGGLNEEALRVVKQMPRWEPGEVKGKKVDSKYKLPITFRLRK